MIKPMSLVLVSICLGITGQMLLKRSMLAVGSHADGALLRWMVGAVFNAPTLVGLMFFGLSFLSWLMVLSRVPLSIAYPMLGLNKVLVVLLAAVLFGEPLTVFKLVGAVLVGTGVWVLSLGL